ncbi:MULTISPECIES: DUF4179 domain-containing protein [unclassified Clostridium]|uniref:DUF4179 domain-containing protein n=1 Tax=unclassified Clostridium TaxID=2614128 RepID=UPI000297CF37|nr:MULTISPECIES: DUF4179 domain-containing protein [unclassified Clostridium]EKQ51556.1 MAG: hypothetical protein A370_04734 [Clostridium sp. Maddingley MBC34-26]
MKNDIYIMLNDANINLDIYEKEDFNDIEKRRIKANFRNSAVKNKSRKRTLIAAGMVLALTITFFGTNVGASALSKVLELPGIKDIASLLRIDKNLDEYKTVVNKSITENGITVQLNEVILDENELTVSYNVTSNRKLSDDESWKGFNGIYINGKEVNGGSTGSSKNIDDYTTQTVMTYDLGDMNLSGDLNIKISCSSIGLNPDKAEKMSNLNFEFKTNGDQLRIDTKEITLNNKFTLENGVEYTLEKYTDNSLGQKIYASISNFKMDTAYDVQLKGADDLGNKVEFYASYSTENKALFKIENIDGNLNENAKTLTLTPYAAEYPKVGGEMNNEFKKAGEAFTIDLSKLK